MAITPEDERRYGLKPLPELPCPGPAESLALNLQYEADRRYYRFINPHRSPADDLGRK